MSASDKFDAVIVGAGGSGLAAAVSAAEHGLRVVVLEKQPVTGGTTGIAVGSFTANRTAMQQRAGIDDTLEHHAEDAGQFAPQDIEAKNNDELRRFFLNQTATTLDWLRGMGLSFHGPSREPPNRVPRMHNVVPGARAYIETLSARLQSLGGEIVCSARVVEVLQEQRQVIGVVAEIDGARQTYHARCGVVLAAGDYASAPDLIARHKGVGYAQVEGINPHAGGDGHRLVDQLGGRLINMDVTYGPEIRFVAPRRQTWQQRLPSRGIVGAILRRIVPVLPDALLRPFIKELLVTWQHPEDAILEDGAILINRQAHRFTNELTSPEREIAIAEQPQKECFLLLDRRLATRYSEWPHFVSTAPQIAYAYVQDYERLRPDVTARAPSLDALARLRDFDPQALQATVDEYNQTIRDSGADRWERQERQVLEDGDWVLLGPARAYFTTTEGGAAINEQFQVLEETGEAIPGLYAVGQNGLGGQILWGHGLHIAWAMTSGRLVGAHLGSLAREGG